MAVLNVVIFVFAMALTWPASGQSQEQSGQKQGQIENTRREWENMSAAEREKLRSAARSSAVFRGSGLQEQLQIIEAIEKQVAQLKTAVESLIQTRNLMQNATEDERPKYRKNITGATQTRQQAISTIEQHLEKLRFSDQQRKLPDTQVDIKELQEIHKLAVKEKATETAKKLEAFIAKYQQKQSQTQTIRPLPPEDQTDRARGLRQ